MQTVQLVIGNSTVGASDGATFTRNNPITGEAVTRAAAATVSDAKKAVDAAAAAFPKWSKTGPSERRAALSKAADLLESKAAEFASLMTAETGSTAGWAHFNIHIAAGMLREAAAITTQITGDVIPSDIPGSLSMAIRQPAGVVVGIAPWNAPVILGVRAIAIPLACGNTVVLKASEVCPAVHSLIGSILQEAGLGNGVVNVITHDAKDAPAIAEALISHPAVRRVNFTGSTRVGKLLAETAAKYLKPILLELGGKAPLVVLHDADVQAAVDATVFSAFANQGQICMSTERVIVDEKVANEFVERLAQRVSALPFGDPRKGEVVLGSVIGKPTVERLQRLMKDAVAKGAKVVAGGEVEGTLMRGIVVDKVTPDMEIFTEESFGPQVSITRVKSDDEAIAMANNTEYGLSAAIFSRDLARAFELAKRIESGICHINGPTVHDEAQMPFGGVKGSGIGRFGGKAGIDAFTETRWITMQMTPRHYPF